MLSPPGPTQHRTPDHVDERQSSPAQPAGVHTDVPVDAPAAAPGRMLHSTDEPRSALPASTTTSAALLDPPPGLQSPSPASVAAPANAPAHDPQPFTLSNTTYVPYVGRDNRLTMAPAYHQPTASDRAPSQAPLRLTGPDSAQHCNRGPTNDVGTQNREQTTHTIYGLSLIHISEPTRPY